MRGVHTADTSTSDVARPQGEEGMGLSSRKKKKKGLLPVVSFLRTAKKKKGVQNFQKKGVQNLNYIHGNIRPKSYINELGNTMKDIC